MKNYLNKAFSYGFLVVSALAIAACSGGSGQENQALVTDDGGDGGSDTLVYQGPTAANDDIISFKQNIWDNLAVETRCGGCHVEGNQAPYFVRHDDINLAYQTAVPLVDLTAPALSTIVTKVGGGHNCWRDEPTVCADTIINLIEAWANDAGVERKEVVLTAPPEQLVEGARVIPGTLEGEAATNYAELHGMLQEYCGTCHAEDGEVRQQQPYFASSSASTSYEAARPRIDWTTPANSRLVQRMRVESHNCGDNCMIWGNNVEAAIGAYASNYEAVEVPEGLQISRGLTMADGIIATSGGRVETDVIASYDFKPPESGERRAYDTSAKDIELDLEFNGNVEYVGGWGIRLNDGASAFGLVEPSEKLHRLITASGEYSIEAWVVPANVTQDGPARIISYTGGSETRNFTLGQTIYNYNFLSRSSNSDANGMPMLSTPDADEILQATLQHVVATFDPIDGRRLYVNGELSATDDSPGGSLNDWNDSYALYLGADPGDSDPWLGVVKFLAIHNRALDQEAVTINHGAGVGEKRFMLFGVSHLLETENATDAYILFEVSQFDDYSYLFNAPRFISLDASYTADTDIVIEGLRIGVNGTEAAVGQAFGNINFTVTSDNYDASAGVVLQETPSGTIVELQQGQAADQFFLSFDRIGSSVSTRAAPPVYQVPVATPIAEETQADIGLRNFAEVSATLSQITSVPSTNSNVQAIYSSVQQQLPVSEAIDGFLAAHQSGVMQLSVAYCTALVEDDTRRAAVFGDFDAAQSSSAFFGSDPSAGRTQIISALINRLLAQDLGTGPLETQPDAGAIEAELNDLVSEMSGNTGNTVIALCAAAAGSAVMLIQ